HYKGKDGLVVPKNPFKLPKVKKNIVTKILKGKEHDQDQKAMKIFFKNHNTSVPMLFKHYTTIVERDGAKFLGFNVDPDFSDCLDGLVLVSLEKLKPKKRERYMGK
ncbi:MAG: hypothetical protein OIF32_05615, partial [Campylobacterales bacterium]|nr:hypothetical protein [Campylobacterales bacterium]